MTQSHYYAKASARNVLSHIRQWLCFTIFFGLCFLPARTEDIIPFLELMALSSGYDHIKAVLGSIGFLHKNLGLSFPADSFQIKITLQALKRRLARAPNQALPIAPEQLLKMYKFIDISNPQDLALWCAFLVGFFGLLRKKSICPEDPSDVDPVKILTVRKVSVDRGKGVALLYINFSKTIQFGQRDLIIPLVSNNCKALDPVYHLDLLLSQTKASPDSPAFLYRTKSGSVSFITHKLLPADSRPSCQKLVIPLKSLVDILCVVELLLSSIIVDLLSSKSKPVEIGSLKYLQDICLLAWTEDSLHRS